MCWCWCACVLVLYLWICHLSQLVDIITQRAPSQGCNTGAPVNIPSEALDWSLHEPSLETETFQEAPVFSTVVQLRGL